MLKIVEWARDKPFHIAILILQSVIFLESPLRIILQKVKHNAELFDVSNMRITAKDWLCFYQDQKHIKSWVEERFLSLKCDVSENNKNKIIIRKSKGKHELSQFLDEIIKSKEFPVRIFQITIGLYEDIVLAKPKEDDYLPDLPDSYQKPEYLFLLKVVLPCIYVYGEPPDVLICKAHQGDIDAIDKLLRIDKTVINDPFIGEQFHQASLHKNKSKYEIMVKALQGQMLGKISPQKVKSILAASISLISEKLGHRLNSTEIRELFNAIAVDRGQDELIDPDLPDSPEAFSQAILRERKNMISLF